MARGINKVILVGNLGNDPEVRYSSNGAAIANLSIATSESWKDKNSGEQQERTEWHRVVLFNRLGEIAGEYLRKGSQVYIEGKLQTRKWQDKDGQDRYTTEIVANELQMLGGRSGGDMASSGQAGYQPQSSGYNSGPSGNAPQQSAPSRGPANNAPQSAPMNDFDDDIPF